MTVIDLCSSDEDEDPTPRKSALESFAPRKEKATGGGGSNGVQNGRNAMNINGHQQRQPNARGDTPRAQPTRPNGVLPANTPKGYDVDLVERSNGQAGHNSTHTSRASTETKQDDQVNGRRESYKYTAPEGASLAALLAGVAQNDNAGLEQLRSSMGKRGFVSPQAEHRPSGAVDKSQRYLGRRISEGVARQNDPFKAQPRKSDGIVKRPVVHSAAAQSARDNSVRPRPSNGSASIASEARPIPPQATSAPKAETSGEHAYSGAGLSITKTAAATSADASAYRPFKKTLGSGNRDEAFEHAAKRRKIDDGGPTLRETIKSSNEGPKSSDEGLKSSNKAPNHRWSFIDKTDPTSERVSYSDEPDLPAPKQVAVPDAIITPPPTAFGRAEDRTAVSSLNAELEAQVSAETTTRQASHSSRGRPARTQTAGTEDVVRATRPYAEKNVPYSDDDRRLLKVLKEVDGLSWDDIVPYFPGRTRGSIQVHYSTKVGGRRLEAANPVTYRPNRTTVTGTRASPSRPTSRNISPERAAPVRTRRARGGGPSAVDGFVSWASIRGAGKDVAEEAGTPEQDDGDHPCHLPKQDHVHSNSALRILRLRELGLSGTRAWELSSRQVTEYLKNHTVNDHSLRKQYHGTSGDVVALSWSANDDRFVAGSIAISDSTSMQYNMSRNLLVGDASAGELRELVEHHVPRPRIQDEKNVNGLHAMRESQDTRLFLTVTAAGFSPRGDRLYTAGTDKQLRIYSTDRQLSEVKCEYAIQHVASVDLLAVHAESAVATGCHAASDSVNVYSSSESGVTHAAAFSPNRSNLEVSVPIYPSAVKWGLAHHHRNYLLTGFAGDEEKAYAGETCLWDVQHEQSVKLGTATRNVFDVAWNPSPSPGLAAFAVAALSTGLDRNKRSRSIVYLFAPQQQDAKCKRTLECPAGDLNDVVFCPYDNNLIATGSADGKVYVWDLRAKADTPLHTLEHGKSVLVEDSPDTGVRFLSWGATASRLYSGSSDGIVKVWNPYRSQTNAHVEDIAGPAHQRSAVMSASFNSDYRELLVGTENGRIDLFDIGGQRTTKLQRFKLHTAPAPKQEQEEEPLEAARSLLATRQIEIRPCGAMPFLQAVQGPNYNGPFLAPSTEETTQAEAAYQDAVTMQHEASARCAAQMIDQDDDEDLSKANKKVQEAQRTIDDLQERLEHFTFAQPKAEQLQRTLLEAEETQNGIKASGHHADPCDLDCTFLPGADELEDSRRAELRIPGMLHSLDLSAALAKDEEADDACAMCHPMNILNRYVNAPRQLE